MELITPPTAADDCRDNWKAIDKLAKFANAFGNVRVIDSRIRNALTLSDGSAIFELMLGAAAGAVIADFAPYDASTTVAGVTRLKVGIRFGRCTPLGVAVQAGVTTYPDVFTADNHYTYSFDVSADGIAYLHTTVDATGPTVTAITIGTGTSLPDYDDSNGYFDLFLWHVDASSGTPRLVFPSTNGVGSQTYKYCGGLSYFDPAGPAAAP